MEIRFALAGNPNSGKTTLFNELTGSSAKVGNWPGVTVERKEGRYKSKFVQSNEEIKIIDLPGIYSLSPYTPEELVARDYLIGQKPDVVINIVDASNLERNLYLTTQIIETNCNVVVALNMMDVIKATGDTIDCKALEKHLGVPVVEISAFKNQGIPELIKTAILAAKQDQKAKTLMQDKDLNALIFEIKKNLKDASVENSLFKAIKIIEKDEVIIKDIQKTKAFGKNFVEQMLSKKELQHSDIVKDPEAFIADQRYKFITTVTKQVFVKAKRLANSPKNKTEKIDAILTNKWLAFPIFILIMATLFQITFAETILGIPMPGVLLQGYMETIIGFVQESAQTLLVSFGAAEWAIGLVCDGIINGLGAILSFIPQIMILFLGMTILEDSGYMARAAFIMDRVLRRFGLSGKSFVPMLMGFGCSVPAIMATRTLESEKERRLTIILTPFMSCGAKAPIYAVFAGALFAKNAGLVVTSLYLLGIVVAVVSAIILNKTVLKGKSSPFIMELPPYRFPSPKSLALHVWEKLREFVIRAGTILLAMTIIIWFLQTFSFSLQMVSDNSQSIMGEIGKIIALVFTPNGFPTWQAAVALLTGLVAKELVVGTLGVLYGAGENMSVLMAKISTVFSPLSAYSFMVFSLLYVPCFAAIATTKKEMGSWKWAIFAGVFQTGVAYIVSALIFTGGKILGLG